MNDAVITNPKIILNDLNFHYGQYHALKSVNLGSRCDTIYVC